MTNLRVFENSRDRRFIEISSQHSTLTYALVVPVLPRELPFPEIPNRAEVVEIRFNNEIVRVAFLLVSYRFRAALDRYRLVGKLEETDSINVLNHVLDILAYP